MIYFFLFLCVYSGDSNPIQFQNFPWGSSKEEVLEILMNHDQMEVIKNKKKITVRLLTEELKYEILFTFKKDVLVEVYIWDQVQGEILDSESVLARYENVRQGLSAKGWPLKKVDPELKSVKMLYRAVDPQGMVELRLEKLPLTLRYRVNIKYLKSKSVKGLL